MKVVFTRKDISRDAYKPKLTRIQSYKERLKEIDVLWNIRKKNHSQSTTPIDPNLSNKLGLRKKDKILYFAGCYGDWAKAIAHQTELTYTDATKSVLEYAKERNKEGIKKFKLITAEMVPQRPMIYDWSVSYEPIPLVMKDTLKFSLTRSLLNKKGAKIIYSPFFEIERSDALKQIEKVSRIYSTQLDIKKINVNTNSKHWTNTSTLINIITLRTNPIARRKAFLDLRILNAVDREKSLTITQLSKRFQVNPLEVIASIKRLEQLTGDYQKGLPINLIKLIELTKKNW
jgi:hypothetical protein